MTENVRIVDRNIRIGLGVVLLLLTVFLEGNLRWLGLIGIMPIVTAIVGNYPLYSLFGIRTCSTEPHRT